MSDRTTAVILSVLALEHALMATINPNRTGALVGVALAIVFIFCGWLPETRWRRTL